MKKTNVLLAAALTIFCLTTTTHAWKKEYTFKSNEKDITFKVERPNHHVYQTLTLPNGKKYLQSKCSDILQGPDGTIFMITNSEQGCKISVFNGEKFYQILKGWHMFELNNAIKTKNNKLVIYSLLPSNGEDEFKGLLIFSQNQWKFYEDKRKKRRNSADIIAIKNHDVMIQHCNWTNGTKPKTSSFNLFNKNFY